MNFTKSWLRDNKGKLTFIDNTIQTLYKKIDLYMNTNLKFYGFQYYNLKCRNQIKIESWKNYGTNKNQINYYKNLNFNLDIFCAAQNMSKNIL